ncbi:46487_t:CDS:2 [Gigaspora margarita]|uniref:46487_t:CDS:1 n=1 Tax=Gigaspora margarita TaxID=4874 RepID=A0ABM8W3U4_GIGMA|nr:46487_t:CDS:2 [Gigaspora margarita]
MRIPHKQNILFYRELVTKVSSFVLKKVHEQYLKVLTANSTEPLPACTGTFSLTMGLPCAHIIKRHLVAHQILNLYDINQYWWIDRSILPQQNLTENNQLKQLLKNLINNIMLGQGRPQSSTKRLLLVFELEELKTTSQKYGICNNIRHKAELALIIVYRTNMPLT